LWKLNPPSKNWRGVGAHNVDAKRSPAVSRALEMARRKLSPREILERLRMIDALIADGRPAADALRLAGLLPAEYERWRSEYAGLVRTLGPFAGAPLNARKTSRRSGSGRAGKAVN
jgi:hypothetical protein